MPTDTRQKLIDAARRLFHEQGYAATGIATILREAGVKPGSLYHFFSGKEALLQAVLDAYSEQLETIVLGPIEATRPEPIERIFDLLAWYRGGMQASGCRHGCPVGNLALELSDTHAEVRPRIDRLLKSWAAGIRRWLDEGAERLPPDVDREALSHFVLTVMEGGLLQSRAAGDLHAFDRSVQVLRDYFDRLLAHGAVERRAHA